MPLNGNPQDWPIETKQGFVFAGLQIQPGPHTGRYCPTCDAAYNRMLDMLGAEPLVFRSKGQPLASWTRECRRRFANTIREVHAHAEEFAQIGETPREEPKQEPQIREEPIVGGDLKTHGAEWLRFIQKTVRPYLAARDADGETLDEWGMRQALAGATALKQGVPVAFLKDSMTMHLPEHARTALGVAKYDPATFRPEDRVSGAHVALPLAMRLIDAGHNIMFVGGKGTGKTTFAQTIADLKQVPLTAVSCNGETGGATFFGLQRIGGDGAVIEAKFSEYLRQPSVILIDEIDGGDENALLGLNRLLANRRFLNELTQEEFDVHPDCVILSGANTAGNGATALYGARNVQDGAAMDRWTKLRLELDEALETELFWSILAA